MRTGTLCVLAAALLVFAAPGCEKDEPQVPADTETGTAEGDADGPRLVNYTRIGGVAGIDEQLTVDEDGAATLELGRAGEASSTEFELTPAELRGLEEALEAADLPPGEAPQTGCADCFVYTITFAGETSSFDQTQVPASAEELVGMLEQLVEDNIPATASAAGGD